MAPQPAPARPGALDLSLLAVAVLGVSASAPLIAATAAPALAIALWRNVLGGAALLAVLGWRGPAAFRLSAVERRAVLLAGTFLAVHFALWVPSVTMTSVASSTALVAAQPVWNALLAGRRGEPVTRRTWTGIALALAGVLVLTGVDVTVSAEALWGDLLALAGGMAAALYVEQGAVARRTLGTATYSGIVYSICAVLLLAGCLLAGVEVLNLSTDAWIKIVALTVLAQLVGHTLINRSLRTMAPVAVSLAILFEPPGAAVMAALWLGQVPPLAAVPAAVLVLGGVALVVADRRGGPEPRDLD